MNNNNIVEVHIELSVRRAYQGSVVWYYNYIHDV